MVDILCNVAASLIYIFCLSYFKKASHKFDVILIHELIDRQRCLKFNFTPAYRRFLWPKSCNGSLRRNLTYKVTRTDTRRKEMHQKCNKGFFGGIREQCSTYTIPHLALALLSNVLYCYSSFSMKVSNKVRNDRRCYS
jgi:hypothetical protein